MCAGADLCGLTEADGSWFEAIQLVEDPIHRHIGNEVEGLVILTRHALLRHYRLGRGEAVVRPPDLVRVVDGQSWGSTVYSSDSWPLVKCENARHF